MKIKNVQIHNFRSIKDSSIDLENYSLLVGENNVGKTSIITALRVFYEDNGIKFIENRDFPKFQTDDNESWIEIGFLTTAEEQERLKDDYKSKDKILKVRRYFKSDKYIVKSTQSNIFAYENSILSENLFYGAKNISQAKLGRVIYIPELSRTDDTLKLSGPSPLREMVNFVFGKIVTTSPSFQDLNAAFNKFNSEFAGESSKDGFSLSSLEEEINDDLKTWGVNFGLRINPIQPTDIVKSLLSHYIEDKNLTDKEIDINSFGQGLQRHLIYTLIKLSAKYVEKKEEKRKDFSPDFALILFEEPEAFLHPSQQEQLNVSLNSLSNELEQQILITTHSPIFVSKNVSELKSIVKVKKPKAESITFQLSDKDINDLLDENISLFKVFSKLLSDPLTEATLKNKIRNGNYGEENLDEEKKLEEETMKYFMWLDAERASLFFARRVIICEGASEKIYLDYLVNNEWTEFKDKHIYFLDALGKYNIHRYMNLFGKLGINHSVLYDKDNDKDIHKIINDFIETNKNQFSDEVYSFDDDFEKYLGIKQERRKDLKPLNILINHKNSSISKEKIGELKEIVGKLIKSS